MSTNNPNDLINIAVILGAFGVKGEVKIKSLTDRPEDFLSYGPLLGEGGAEAITVTSSRPVKGGFAVLCDQVDTPEQAKAMNGTKLYVPKSVLPEPDEDEFYYADLIGLSVKTDSGKNMGTVIAVNDFGAGDILEIQPPKKLAKKGESQKSWYHPFTKKDVPIIDMKARRIVIVMPEVLNAKDPVKGEEE